MTDFLFRYLNKEKIKIDKDEFILQFNSHPDSPSLLAISDTLRFLEIKNAAIKVETAEIDFLPVRFVARLWDKEESYLTFIEKKGNSYSYVDLNNKKKAVTADEFKTLFGNVILLAEDEKERKQIKTQKANFSCLFPFLIVLILILYRNFQGFWIYFFYVFPILGVIFSILALRELFNVNSIIFNRFCNMSDSYDCNAVVNSSKWKILEKVNFSDLGITFFLFQIISLLSAGFSSTYSEYFFVQYALLLVSMPIGLISLYYQRFVEKKWCPVCLTIIGIIVLELGYVLIFIDIPADISITGTIPYFFIYAFLLMVWFPLKKLLERQRELKEEQLKYNRFKKNYQAFKNNLLAAQKFDLPANPILLEAGNPLLQITLITNPFCGSCANAHKVIHGIIEKDKGENISLDIIFNYDENLYDSNAKLLFGNIINSKLIGNDVFKNAVDGWFKEKNLQKWLRSYGNAFDPQITDPILKAHKDWCIENSMYFTPCILINGYEYPSIYEIADLPFFLDELLDDSI